MSGRARRLKPQITHGYQARAWQPGSRHPRVGGQGRRQRPVALGAQRRQHGLALTCAQGQERADCGAHPAPLLPRAHADTPPPPVVQRRDGTVGVREAAVMHPASEVAREPFQPRGHRPAPSAPGELPDAVRDVGEGRLGPTPFGAPEGEAEAHDRLGPTPPALGRVHAALKRRGQHAREAGRDALPGAPAVDQDQPVVGLPREPVATALPLVIKVVQPDIGEPRGERGALSGPPIRCLDAVPDQATRPQVAAAQAQEPLIAHLTGHARQPPVVGDPVAALLQVHIHGDAIPRTAVPLYLPERSRGGASGSKADARRRALRVEQRREDLRAGRRDHPVQPGGNAALTCPPTAGRWNRHPAYRCGLLGAVAPCWADGGPVLACDGGAVLQGHAVHARCSLVGLHRLPCPAPVPGSTTCALRSSCKAGGVGRRRSLTPPVGVDLKPESFTAPPCALVFGPAPRWPPGPGGNDGLG